MTTSTDELRGLQADLNYFADKLGLRAGQGRRRRRPPDPGRGQGVYDAVVKAQPILASAVVPPTSAEEVVARAPLFRAFLSEQRPRRPRRRRPAPLPQGPGQGLERQGHDRLRRRAGARRLRRAAG
ncbi:MAG: hypothetical protein HS111_06435 [Kofleriaceae bacterium]|nr:hypothetical protein [Kofleriaceae bacterium]